MSLPTGSQPTLRQLELFIAVPDHRSIAAAAADVFATPDVASDAVTELETLLNSQCFIRRRAKGLTLTAAGQDLVVRARDLLDRANELTLHIGNVSDVPRG